VDDWPSRVGNRRKAMELSRQQAVWLQRLKMPIGVLYRPFV